MLTVAMQLQHTHASEPISHTSKPPIAALQASAVPAPAFLHLKLLPKDIQCYKLPFYMFVRPLVLWLLVMCLQVLTLNPDTEEGQQLSAYEVFDAYCVRCTAVKEELKQRRLDDRLSVVNKLEGTVLELAGEQPMVGLHGMQHNPSPDVMDVSCQAWLLCNITY